MSKQFKIAINYFLGPIIFIVLSWSLYLQIKNQPDVVLRWHQIQQSWSSIGFWVAVLLMIVNWGIESRKWQVLVKHLQPISFVTAFKSVLSGCSITMLTPNRVGEYGGRILFINDNNKLKAVSLAIVGSISQLLVTLIMGCCGLIFLKYFSHNKINSLPVLPEFWGDVLIYLSGGVTIVLSLFYLRIGWLVRAMEKVPAFERAITHIRILDEFDNIQLIRVFSLSFGRYVVFVLQYILLLYAMQVTIEPITCFWLIAVFYLVLALAPTIGLIELPIRVGASWAILKFFTTNELGVGAASLGIWVINLVVPAIIGSLLILSIKKIIR